MQHLGSDVPNKGRDTKENAENVDNVISIVNHLACSASVFASLLIGLDGA